MILLVALYYIGKAFYDLASKYSHNKWLYAILGVVSYYVTILLVTLLIGLVGGFYFPEFIENTDERLLGLTTIPFGILACRGFYVYLRKRWSAEDEEHIPQSDLLDDTFIKDV